jgi:hypothetical protein
VSHRQGDGAGVFGTGGGGWLDLTVAGRAFRGRA